MMKARKHAVRARRYKRRTKHRDRMSSMTERLFSPRVTEEREKFMRAYLWEGAMIRKFQLEEACPFYHLGKFLNLAHFKDATDRHSDLYNDNVLRKNLYNIIARDVNAYCEEHNVVSMIRPGDNIEIKTSLLSVYDDIPVVINLKRTDFDQWQAWIYSTPLMQFAICFDPPFSALDSMTQIKQSRNLFEEFFNRSCSKEILRTLQNASEDNIVLPAGTCDSSGRYPLFVRFSRNQRAAYPPYKLDLFVKSPADRSSRLGRDILVLNDSVEKARIKVARGSITGVIEQTMDAIGDEEWRQKLQNAREMGKEIAGDLSFGNHVFTLLLVRNRNLVLSSFGNWTVPDVVLLLHEKKFVRPADSRQGDNAAWLDKMEWHGDLAADLARLAGCREEDVDITAMLKSKNLEELCRQSQDAPAWFDSGLTADIPGRDAPVRIWGRMDYNPHSTKPYVLRLFSIWEPGHPLNRFATCFVSPFMDLADMLNNPERRDLLSIMQHFGDLFKNAQSQEGTPLETVGFFKQNEIYCGRTDFYIGTKKNYICAYFSRCEYYRGMATPYFLNFFYYENPYAGMNGSSRMQKAVEYMLIGNMIQNATQPKPNVLASIREFKRVRQKENVSPNEEGLFQLFLQAQKRAIVAQEQFRLERAERGRQRDALLRRLFHQIGHYTSAMGGNVILAQEAKGDAQNRYFDAIRKIAQDVNSSVDTFKVLTSDRSELRKRFNSSLIYGRDEACAGCSDPDGVRTLRGLFYESLHDGIGRILTERERFDEKLKSYLARYFTLERWKELERTEQNRYVEMLKKDLLISYPHARALIEGLSVDTLDADDTKKVLELWSHTSIEHAYAHLDKRNDEQFAGFMRRYFFSTFSIAGTEHTYFDSKDDLSYNCMKSILDEWCFNALKYAEPGGALELECLHDKTKFILCMKNDMVDAQKYGGSSTGLQGCEGIVAMLGGEMPCFVEQGTGSNTARFVVGIKLNLKDLSDEGRD